MSYLVLARKYRPNTFEEVVGQEGVVRTLQNAIGMKRVAHAYLFTGARGVGKTTVARLLAKALNCEQGPTATPDNTCPSCLEIIRGSSPDVFEIDGASNTGVDDIRQLRDNSQYLPARSRYKIYIIDEVHMLSTSAFNALLKTLEEPPEHVKFIFATTEAHKIPVTVLSRCQRFDFKRISSADIQAHLDKVLTAEGMQIEPEGLRIIARQAGGSIRDSLSLTDQVLAFGGETISAEQVRTALGLADAAIFEEVIEQVLQNRPDELMQLVEKLFDEGHDLKRFIEGLLWHVHRLVLFRSLKKPDELVDLLDEERERLRNQAGLADRLRWHQIFDVLSRCAEDLGRHPYPRLVLETSLLRLTAIEPVVSIDELLARAEALAKQVTSGQKPSGGGGTGSSGDTRRVPPPTRTFTPPTQQAKFTPPTQQAEPPAPQPQQAPKPGNDNNEQEAWEALVALVAKRRPSLGSFLSHARMLKASAGLVRFAFVPGSFFADQVKSDRNVKELEQLCSEFFAQATKIKIEEIEKEGNPDLAPSLADTRETQAKEIQVEKERKAREHPMVKEAIRVFGAEVIDVRTDLGRKD